MSTQLSDIERAEMMLSLGINEEGQPLTDEQRTSLTELVDAVKNLETAPEPTEVPQATQEAPQGDLQAMIQAEIARQIGSSGGAPSGPVTVEQFLASVDPKNSEVFLALFQACIDTGRVQKIGSIDGGGYIWHYAEPKGTTNEGYTPGKTKGGRMVDQALENAKAAGAKPKKVGMCDKCFGAVEQHEDGSITNTLGDPVCPNANGGPHNFNG